MKRSDFEVNGIGQQFAAFVGADQDALPALLVEEGKEERDQARNKLASASELVIKNMFANRMETADHVFFPVGPDHPIFPESPEELEYEFSWGSVREDRYNNNGAYETEFLIRFKAGQDIIDDEARYFLAQVAAAPKMAGIFPMCMTAEYKEFAGSCFPEESVGVYTFVIPDSETETYRKLILERFIPEVVPLVNDVLLTWEVLHNIFPYGAPKLVQKYMAEHDLAPDEWVYRLSSIFDPMEEKF